MFRWKKKKKIQNSQHNVDEEQNQKTDSTQLPRLTLKLQY